MSFANPLSSASHFSSFLTYNRDPKRTRRSKVNFHLIYFRLWLCLAGYTDRVGGRVRLPCKGRWKKDIHVSTATVSVAAVAAATLRLRQSKNSLCPWRAFGHTHEYPSVRIRQWCPNPCSRQQHTQYQPCFIFVRPMAHAHRVAYTKLSNTNDINRIGIG